MRSSFRTRLATSGSTASSAAPEIADNPRRVKDLPRTDASWSRRRSSSGTPSSRDVISACRDCGTSNEVRSPVTMSPPPACSSTPRSRSIRTVSTAYSGMPSAASRSLTRTSSGSPGTSPSSSSSMASSSRGSSGSVVELRIDPGKPGWRSATSGRASVTTKIGWCRPQSSRYSTNATSPSSAQWMSSKTITSGPCSASRSKKRRQAEKRSSRSGRSGR